MDTEKIQSQIYRRNFDISFNELYDMYKEKELIISPQFQRLFRWSQIQQSLLIESILLDMPIPPIYVDEQLNGNYLLIDGLQRITTYLLFRGVNFLKETGGIEEIENSEETGGIEEIEDEEAEKLEKIKNSPFKENFQLVGCEIRDDLNGKTYEDLDSSDRIRLKRNFIRIEVVTKQNEPQIKYHMFKRLNSGGLLLEAQELRNSNIRMLGNEFIDFINKISDNSNYKKITEYIKEADKFTMKRNEHVLRFFLYKNRILKDDNINNYEKQLEESLTEYLEDVTLKIENFDYRSEEKNFISLVNYVCNKFESDLFKSIDKNGIEQRRFLLAHFDGFMNYFADESKRNENITSDDIKNIKMDIDYKKVMTGGKNNTLKRIELIDQYLSGKYE